MHKPKHRGIGKVARQQHRNHDHRETDQEIANRARWEGEAERQHRARQDSVQADFDRRYAHWKPLTDKMADGVKRTGVPRPEARDKTDVAQHRGIGNVFLRGRAPSPPFHRDPRDYLRGMSDEELYDSPTDTNVEELERRQYERSRRVFSRKIT